MQGPIHWSGSLDSNDVVELYPIIKIEHPGSYNIWAKIYTPKEDYRYSSERIIDLYIVSTDSIGLFGSDPPPEYYPPPPHIKSKPLERKYRGDISISGQIAFLNKNDDNKSYPLPTVRVTLRIYYGSECEIRSKWTDEEGRYEFQNIPSGSDLWLQVHGENEAAWFGNDG